MTDRVYMTLSNGEALLEKYHFKRNGDTWFRYRNIRTHTGQLVPDRSSFVTGPDDHSANVGKKVPVGYTQTYHPKCSTCFLGYPHSVAYHNQNLRRQNIDPYAPIQPEHWRSAGIVSPPLG